MTWLLSVLTSWLPDLWILPAIAASGLWLYSHFVPNRIAAEIVKGGVIGLVGLAVYLWVYAGATAACEARVKAATTAEEARQQTIVGDALTEARAAAADATRDREAAEARLFALMSALPADPKPPASGYGGGLSPATVKALRAARPDR